MILLGTGTSVGVPMIGCHCEVCRSTDPRNQRTRCGVAVVAPEGTFLIDTPPELRLQLVREEIDLVHAALFTHDHADHIFGLDDLRIFGQYLDQAVPLYCEESVETQIRRAFHYAFSPPHPNAHAGATPRLSFQRIDSTPFQLLGLEVVPIRLWHGQLPVFGFRIGNVAYCTDVSRIPDESLPLLEDLDVLILDALRERPHPTHFSVEQSLEVIKAVQPRRAYLTHISHFLDHQSTSDALPDHVELAHDGLRIPLALPDVPRIPEAPQRQQWRTLVYLALAQRSHTRGPWPARDRLLLLAATAASRAGWSAEAHRCCGLVLRANPRHLIGKHPSIEAALEHSEYQPFDRQLQRLCPLERAEWLLQQQQIDLPLLSGEGARETVNAILDTIDDI